jgi:hypothetical protein
MSELVLVEIEFNSKKWYLSEEGYIGESYYAPYLSETPTLELGEVKGGYIGVRLGDLSIANRPNDRFSPFSIFGGGYARLLANPTQKIPVQIYWQQNKRVESIFDGTMYLKGLDKDSFNFLLEDKVIDVDLLSEARDYNSAFVSVNSISITGEGDKGYVSAPDHGLEEGDFIKVSLASNSDFETIVDNVIDEVRIEYVDENHFRYPFSDGITSNVAFIRSSDYLMEAFAKKPEPFSFGEIVRKKDIIQTEAREERFKTGDFSGFEFSNPDLDPNNADYPIFLFDDGVLVGASDANRSGRIINPIEVTSCIRNVNSLKLYTATKHNLLIGSTCALSGFLPEQVNTTGAFYVVSEISDPDLSSGGPWWFTVYARLSTDIDTISIDQITGTLNASGPPSGRYKIESTPTGTTVEFIYNSTTYTLTTTTDHNLYKGFYFSLNISGTAVTVKSVVETPGEYFGPSRLPTNEIIYSRAYWVDLPNWQNFVNGGPDGSGNNPINPDGTANTSHADYETYIRRLDNIPLTSNDGTFLLGTPLVSGMSKNGRTLSDFFELVARKVGVENVDFSAAPDASSLNLQLWVTSQTKTLEYAGEVSYAANHLFEIKNNILRAIDRSYQPEKFLRINNWDIIEAKYEMPTPIKALRSKWTENVTNPKTQPTSLTTREESVMISNLDSGEITDISPVTENPVDAEALLLKIREIVNKTVITLKIGNIRSDIIVGTRIKANRDEDGISIDMVVRTIKYNFGSLDTEVVGDGTIFVIEQDQVY